MSPRRDDLAALIERARRALADMPGRTRLPGMTRDLNERERVALAYLEAAAGILDAALEVELEHQDSEPIDG